MKVNVGADMDSANVRALLGAAANASDVTLAHDLLSGNEGVAFGDPGHQDGQRRPTADPGFAIVWDMAVRPGERLQPDWIQRLDKLKEHVAPRLSLRHDHGSQYLAEIFQREIGFLGIEPSPSVVRTTEGSDDAEQIICTVKGQSLSVRQFATDEELRPALRGGWMRLYNRQWLI